MKARESSKDEFCGESKKRILEEIPDAEAQIERDVHDRKQIVGKLVKCTRKGCDNICAGYSTEDFEQCESMLELERVEKEEEIRNDEKRVDLLKQQADALEAWCQVTGDSSSEALEEDL